MFCLDLDAGDGRCALIAQHLQPLVPGQHLEGVPDAADHDAEPLQARAQAAQGTLVGLVGVPGGLPERLSADLRAALKLADQSVAEGEGGIRESLPYGAEVVAAGVTFGGWVAVDAQASDVERAALRKAFDLAFPADADGVRDVFLGGGANRGLGLARLEIDLSPVAPDTAAYDTYLQTHGDEIRRYLSSGKLVPAFQAAP